MAPRKEGFNLLGWLAPFIAVAGGAIAVGAILKSWRTASTSAAPSTAAMLERQEGATDEELARLDAAVRDDS